MIKDFRPFFDQAPSETTKSLFAIIDLLDDLARIEKGVDRLIGAANWSQLWAFIEQLFPSEG